MAWRIHDSVIRGEIDNRANGTVRGRIWLAGLPGPVVLELAGNACADLAGCHLRFTNPHPPVPLRPDAVFAEQRGRIGDLTASRKVRVFDVPFAEAYETIQRGGKPPEHLANCLYLEWFSQANGRVVIESADYRLEISPPAWQLMGAEEQQRQADMAAGWNGFVGQLNDAIEQQQRDAKDHDADWDEHDYERFLKECDARTDKYMELIEKYGDSAEAQDEIAKQMGWSRELSDEEAEAKAREVEELNAACEEAPDKPPPPPDPAREGIDWIRTDDGEIRHPLQHRCFESSLRFHRACDELGVTEQDDSDLEQFLFEFHTTGAKLAGALMDIAQDRALFDAAFTVAYLKRALDHLHKSQAGLEGVAAKPLLPAAVVADARRELFEIREGILQLMQELRTCPPGIG